VQSARGKENNAKSKVQNGKCKIVYYQGNCWVDHKIIEKCKVNNELREN
jgi:hypothetical protein